MSESLFKISADLARLMNQRTDLIEALSVAPTANDQVSIGRAIEAIEQQIREEALPNQVAKVDRFRGYYLHAKMMRDAAKQEKNTQAANEKLWDDRMALMKRIGAAALEAAGTERIDGKAGHIRFQPNGGAEPPPLISQPELVPDCLQEVTVKFRADTWDSLCRVGSFGHLVSNGYAVVVARAPSQALIRAELESNCERCGGKGFTEGSQHDPHTLGMGGRCERCGGTGKGSVAGCSLQERGQHVRIS